MYISIIIIIIIIIIIMIMITISLSGSEACLAALPGCLAGYAQLAPAEHGYDISYIRI